MSEASRPALPVDADGILKLAARSMFELFSDMAQGMMLVDRAGRVVWINEAYKKFLPALGFESVEQFVKASGLMEVQVTVLTPFPGTALYRRLRREGRLLRERYWERCTLFDVNFVPRRMTVDDLEQGLEYLMGSLYTAEAVQHRRALYLDAMRRVRAGAPA